MSAPLNKLVGKNIKHLRTKKKLTQEALSEASNVGYKYIQLIEGKSPPNISLKTIEKISKALGVTPENLLKAR
ncbi:MAG: helix-turn-helix transcriptional regulator [Candidatus Omnitrophica bacterium]|nr:helix-turn-helix transcriptional regulator [Candidatus Omnitrophota bacterium]